MSRLEVVPTCTSRGWRRRGAVGDTVGTTVETRDGYCEGTRDTDLEVTKRLTVSVTREGQE